MGVRNSPRREANQKETKLCYINIRREIERYIKKETRGHKYKPNITNGGMSACQPETREKHHEIQRRRATCSIFTEYVPCKLSYMSKIVMTHGHYGCSGSRVFPDISVQ
jgi:hypothetical protein